MKYYSKCTNKTVYSSLVSISPIHKLSGRLKLNIQFANHFFRINFRGKIGKLI